DFWGPADTHLRLSFEWVSISFLVKITRPKIWVHSETMLPATCPHFELGSDLANRTIQKAPVISRKMLRECSCSFSSTGLSQWRGGLRLAPVLYSCAALRLGQPGAAVSTQMSEVEGSVLPTLACSSNRVCSSSLDDSGRELQHRRCGRAALLGPRSGAMRDGLQALCRRAESPTHFSANAALKRRSSTVHSAQWLKPPLSQGPYCTA